jgi:hypothetical protein
MKKIHKIICLSIVIAASLPTMIEADTIDLPPSPKVAIMLLANRLGAETGIPSSMLKSIVKAESGYDNNTPGDHGQAIGICQYHKQTFDQYAGYYYKATGITLVYGNAADELTLMDWQFEHYPQSRKLWSTYRRIYKNVKVS